METQLGHSGVCPWALFKRSVCSSRRAKGQMGLHRDGEKWNLPADVVEERRRVFWHCRSAEVFQVSEHELV